MQTRNQRGYELLLRALRSKSELARLSDAEWDLLIPAAERTRLSGRLAADADEIIDRLPVWARDRLVSARIRGQASERAIRWEVDRVQRALAPLGVPLVLLKGAGYVAAGLACGVGRIVADVDVLVPESDLPRVQDALEDQGWTFVPQTPYDERYYRKWMHELPPMVHRQRGTVLDVHHAILPRTSRLRPSTRVLLERAVPAGDALVLCPTHMVLHAAVHLFHDGEVSGAIRDLADLDVLLRTFGSDVSDFWSVLVGDGRATGLERPVFYALRYAHRVLGTPIPDSAWSALENAAPATPVLRLMDAFVDSTLGGGTESRMSTSAFALYVRSHWLRMPPLLLARHLTHKAVTR